MRQLAVAAKRNRFLMVSIACLTAKVTRQMKVSNVTIVRQRMQRRTLTTRLKKSAKKYANVSSSIGTSINGTRISIEEEN